ncbi:uncharacterized protein LOC124288741 [Haliotis rubra]|uniref:uncharacterized protein LOC124288741 n=1 Tax=Haliotis rubra TaxID=36100 RepID=UPI001EE5F230|nr:uncharacterized protein LOC124288741 [Haliotis rubra]
MSVCNVVTLWFCILTTCEFASGLRQYGINVIATRTYFRVYSSTSCGFLWIGRCSRYSRQSRLTFQCKPGYRSDDNIGCPHKCRTISNCQTEACTTSRDQMCSLCDGVVSHVPGHRAYLLTSNKKSCTQTCSWRSDSTRCYPGTCKGEYASSCSCSSGFTGQHCQTITTEPTINSNVFRLTTSNGNTAREPSIINSGQIQSTTWSNIRSPSRMYYKFTAKYQMVPPSRHAFIEDFRVGIVGGSASFKLKRRRRVVSTKVSVCGGASQSSPETDLFTCEGNRSVTSVLTLPFQDKDVIVVSYKATNGGYVKVRNKETKNLATFYYSGASQTRTFTMTIDLVLPYHCTGSSTCVGSMLTAPNAITTSTLNLRWSGWSDTDAGVDHFVRDVYELHAVGDVLRDKRRIDKRSFTSSKTSDKFRVSKPGVFSVILSVYDKAGNYRRTRRIVVYDGTSTVTTRANKKLRVMTASAAASAWQTTSSAVTVDWTNRYINTVHHNNKWLLGVASLGDISSDYDDNEGSRGIGEVRNVQGITRFRTSYKVDHQGGSSITSPPADNLFTSQGLNQSETITHRLLDGDTVRFWVRAYDIMLDMTEEHVTVHIDTSPPIMENLWLTRSGSLNISVHRVEELHDVIMEFDVHDEHSGVEKVEWRVVKKQQDEDIVLAVHDISIQSHRTLDDCNIMRDARDGNCYCTPAGTCYHPHFQVKPALADIRDVKLAEGREYWFQVTAANHAKLKSEQEVKIQMDASPPHPGVVDDGLSGQPEVDSQNSLQLHAHWEGFFDRECNCLLPVHVRTKMSSGTRVRPQQNPKRNSMVGKNLVLVLSATASAVVAVAVAGIVVGVVVWKRKRRGNPETSDQAVYYNTGSSKNDKPKKKKLGDKRIKPEAKAYDPLDVNTRETVPEEEPYCSIQTSGSDETDLYEPVGIYRGLDVRPIAKGAIIDSLTGDPLGKTLYYVSEQHLYEHSLMKKNATKLKYVGEEFHQLHLYGRNVLLLTIKGRDTIFALDLLNLDTKLQTVAVAEGKANGTAMCLIP